MQMRFSVGQTLVLEGHPTGPVVARVVDADNQYVGQYTGGTGLYQPSVPGWIDIAISPTPPPTASAVQDAPRRQYVYADSH